MEEKNKREEIQSRREFFKKAAKAALPVVGAAILSSVPFVKIEASGYDDCGGGCRHGCLDNCAYGCDGTCSGTCTLGCQGGCSGGCSGSCYQGCSRQAYA